MTIFPHRYHLQFGTPGPHCPEKAAFATPTRSVRDIAKKFLAFRRSAQAADQSVDTFMRRGETTTRFAYFDN